MKIAGLDIGGANIKLADADGRGWSQVFPMWKEHRRLCVALSEMLDAFGEAELIAVTMTAELADCFETKAEGIAFLLDAVVQAADGRPVFVWQTGGEFVTADEACELPQLVAAANWHALATWAGRIAPTGKGLLADIGSTTADFIPIENGLPVPAGRTDVERLQSGELVYSGVRRTPLCAVAPSVQFRGVNSPMAAELFATTLDVYLLLGDLPENRDDGDTANGRPATIEAAHDRIARMLCCDRDDVSLEDARGMALELARAQFRQLSEALAGVAGRLGPGCRHVVVSGSGSFLAERVVRAEPWLADAEIVILSKSLPGGVSDAACAFAVARLAAERLGPLFA